MLRLYFYLGILLLWGSCNTAASLPDEVQPYFPSPQLLQEGIAQKYYFHYQEKGSSDIATNINYTVYRLTSDSRLEMKEYNADFSPVRYRIFSFDGGQMLIDHYQQYQRQDSLAHEIIQAAFRHFEQDSSLSITQMEGDAQIQAQQTNTKDTILLERAAKWMEGYYLTQAEGTENPQSLVTFKECYAAGLGLCERYAANEQVSIRVELVEQFPLSAFRQMQNHGKQRIAYIHPDSTLGYRPEFQLCNTTADIIDYYNPEDDIGYRGGKHALWQIIRPKLKPELLNGISGYLTFRFVVNCEGKSGRFVFEPTSLDFQPMQVPVATIEHLGEITAALDEWAPAAYRGEPKDAYVYLTYKLQDGELVELLP
jgi:hypothetical protein